MKKLSFTKGLLLLMLFAAGHKLQATQFSRLSLAEAKTRAAQLQRPLLVHFYANWCLPCQWMEQNTFADPEVSAYLDAQYLAVKIDIDEVQGFADKEACGVFILPTLLVFNTAGIVVGRYEKTLNAAPLLDLLHQYNKPENRIPQIATTRVIRTSTTEVRSLVPEKDPHLSAETEDDPARLDAQRRLVPSSSNNPSTPGVRKMGVQLGAYTNYEHVIQQVQFFEKKLNKPLNITSSSTNGYTYYHLIAGPFETPAQMQAYLNALQREGIKGLVVSM